MEFTNEELDAMHTVLYDQYFYGEEYMYQDSDMARAVGTALREITEEIARRRVWRDM